MRTDVIPTLLKKHKLKPNQKTFVLYATQPILTSDKEIKIQQYHDFFKVCSKLPQFQFIIKPHPNEKKLGTLSQNCKEI